ncbi:CmcJ/NvfI family oxidoreductase [Bradyrhizobium pachyrhizi]|uniref:CmcJ/NvfI family oxidoreductase n=1 Tax=Bradyrhizobium pachyrhizi TaxID=280333 RepID=UPI000A9E1CB1|nr:CmcJ/NvfI family oxidoreductase [Bradyrhizobium pachyrhizi]
MQTTSRARVDRAQLESVSAKVAFAQRTSHEQGPELVVPGYDGRLVVHEVDLRSATPIASDLSLDREGFALVRCIPLMPAKRDGRAFEQWTEVMAPIIRDHFDASWVVSDDKPFVARSVRGSGSDNTQTSGFSELGVTDIGIAHCEYTPESAPVVAVLNTQKRSIPTRLYSRLIIVHVWTTLSPTIESKSLALCDARSIVDIDDDGSRFTPEDVGYRGRIINYSPFQLWYYFPNLSAGEAVLFKRYDSKEHHSPVPVRAFFCDPTRPVADEQQSIEARFFVYFD